MSVTGDPTMQAPNGFTLIEMLVVIAIAALIAGIMFPSLQQSLGYWGSRSALTSVRAGLGQARARALGTGMPVRFALTAGGNGFAVGNAAPVALPPMTRLTAAPSVITFYDDGSASGGSVAIWSGAVRATLTVAPGTGLTSVSQ